MATEVWNLGGEEETRLELPPGFRFHPTDEEIVSHYLTHKALNSNVIADVDLNKIEPWDLPSKAKIGEKEWCHKDRKHPTGMRTTVSGYWKDKETFRSHRVLCGMNKTHPRVDVSAPISQYSLSCMTKWIAGDDVRLGEGDQDEPDQFRCPSTRVMVFDSSFTCRLLELMNQWVSESSNFTMSKERDCLHSSVGEPKPSLRFSTSDVLDKHRSWATRLNIALEAAAPLMHSLLHQYSVVRHADLKPSKVLLDSQMEANISDFGVSRLLHVDLSHHPIIKMLPSARKWSGDIFTSCARLITSNRIFGMAETGWISPKPEYDTPNAGPVSEYIIRKLFGIWNGLTVNESQQHSDPDSSRSDHGEMRVNTKASASWILATAAPHHATGDRNLLSGFTMVHDDQFVHAVNRVPMKVLARGAVVTDALVLPDVWFVPGLKENLVSVSQLAELDHSIGFGRGECCIRSARDAKILGKGRLQKGGHYVLDYLKVPLAI